MIKQVTNKNKKAVIIYILPVIFYAILILYLSVLPVGNSPPPPEPPPANDTSGFEPADSRPAETMLYIKYNVPLSDILANIALYIGFGFLLFRMIQFYYQDFAVRDSVQKKENGLQLNIFLLVIYFSICYSVFNETAQTQIESRVADIMDIFYNIIGACLGAAIPFLYNKRMRKGHSKINK